MENQEVLRSNPLSYEASKAVLKSLKLETRESINRRIPALRTINFRLPYVLENVVISDDFFETDGRRWIIERTRFQRNPLRLVVQPRMRVITIYDSNSHKKAKYLENKSDEKILEKLFDEYIKDGTVVRETLCFTRIPEFLKRRSQNEEDLKMKVTNLEMDIFGTNDQFFRFIDLDVLENVKIIAYENALTLFDKPEIKTCKNLTIYSRYLGRPTNLSIDQFLRLRNQHLQIKHIGFILHDLQLFVQDWITTGREIGTRFSWWRHQSEDILPIPERLKTHLGGVEAGSHLDYYFSNKTIHGKGITLKMGEDRELVMYCCQDKTQPERYHDFPWLFEMEVVSSTTSAGTVPTPDV